MATGTLESRQTVWLTARIACDVLGTHYRQLRQLVADGRIEERRLSPDGHPRYSLASINRFLQGGQSNDAPPAA